MAKCTNCGAQLKGGANFCSSCGTKVTRIEKVAPSVDEQDSPKYRRQSDFGFKFNHIYTANITISKEVFLRNALIQMARNIKAPSDVVDSYFSEIKTSYIDMMTLDSYVYIDYHVEIGIDRTEWYTVSEQVYNSSTQKWETQYVQKSRIVTDWSFLHDTYQDGTYAIGENNTDISFNEKNKACQIIRNLNNSLLNEIGEASLNRERLQTLRGVAANQVANSICLPGDRSRNFSFTYEDDIRDVSCYLLPQYQCFYDYKGAQYAIKSFACGNDEPLCETPANDVDYVENAKEITHKKCVATRVLWFVFLGLIIGNIVALVFGDGLMFPLPLGVLIAAMIVHKKYVLTYHSILKEYSSGDFILRLQIINDALIRHNLPRLSEMEETLFDCNRESDKFVKQHKKHSFGVVSTFAIIAMVIIVIMSFLVLFYYV